MNLAPIWLAKTHDYHAVMWLITVLRKPFVSGDKQSSFSLNHLPESIVCHTFICCSPDV
jgi:hypothetical protein